MKQLSLETLRTFVTIVELDGFGRAGELLGRSQPAVSLQIKKLEEQLSTKLFQKEGQRQIVNQAGKKLYEMAIPLLQQNDQIIQFFTETPVSGQLRLGIPSEFATRLLPSIIGAFNNMYPEVTLEVTSSLSETLYRNHRNKAFDLLLTISTDAAPDTEKNLLLDDLVWVTSSNHSPNLDPVNLVVAPEGCRYRARILNLLSKTGFNSTIRYTISDITGITAAIQEGLGITALAKSTVPTELQILQDERLPQLGKIAINLTTNKQQNMEAVEKLEEFIRSRLALELS